ncbi:MAG: hypothetical protein Tsb0020_14490 [Haliangiales bacterium]
MLARQQHSPVRLPLVGVALSLALALAPGCGDDSNSNPMNPDAMTDAMSPDAAPGLAEGIFAPLGEPMPSATDVQLGTFERGRDVSIKRFSPEEGLGPHFNVSFCAACHEKPVFGGSAGRYRNFLLVGQVLPDNSFGQTAINGVQPQYFVDGADPDGSRRFDTDDKTNVMATRNAIPFFGVGLLAEISEDAILANADPDDADGDGISGRPNYIEGFLGRFGRKAQNAAIESFIRGPLFNHLGITSNPLPDVRRAQLPVASTAAEDGSGDTTFGALAAPQAGAPDEPLFDNDSAPDPELSEDDLFDLVSFSMLLAAPMPDPPTPESEAGKDLFNQLNCSGCHVESLRAPRGLIPAYTDLLIHDMGPGMDDGIVMALAGGSEFRTAPLWGVAATAPYLHDGSADTLDDAIRRHGGEAATSRDDYVALSDEDRELVLTFLRSLGGSEQTTAGLLPPGAEIPAVGEYGAPETALTGADLDRYRRGRALFDRDYGLKEGLGPVFNGDSCRACHFDPVLGGSGPADVDVIRHGRVFNDVFTAPDIGTMAPRHSADPSARPAIDPDANVFEARQTPPLFGLGMIDRIPEDTLLALEDPDDADDDGISGRAHVLDDGRIGRLGWKANVPSVAEFARDATSAEMGITLPDQAGLTFGATTDGDDIDDPEISLEALEDLVFFMQSLGPPPRTSVAPELEDEGEIIFGELGCGSCHQPVLLDNDGVDVPLYSDLLLHDVAAATFRGIEDGLAGMREFRTPPLWGLATTAPYMHDGSATTVEDAIIAHSGEAKATRDAYLDLPPAEQRAVLAFLESL